MANLEPLATDLTVPVSILEMLTNKVRRLERREIKAPFQIVIITGSAEPESHIWKLDKESAYSVARALRKKYPDAVRVVVYDHCPKAKEF